MMLPSASRWPRLAACPAAYALPQVESEPGPPAERGSASHAYLAAWSEHGREAALETVPAEYLPFAESIDLPDELVRSAVAELSIVVSLSTGVAREVGRGSASRKYGELADDEVPGTYDLVAVDLLGRRGLLADWKTGRTPQPPAAQHWQLLIGAFAIARLYGLEEVEMRLVQIREDGSTWTDRATLDALDLDTIRSKAEQVARRLAVARALVAAGVTPNVSEGPQCRYCPAFAACPAKVGLAVAIAQGGTPPAIPPATSLTPELYPAAYAAWQRMQETTKAVGAMLHAVAREWGEAPIGDGKVLREVTKSQETLVGDGAYELLLREYGEPMARTVVEMSASKERLRDALRPFAAKGKLAALNREVLNQLRGAGAVKVTTSRSLKEVRE